MRSLPALVLGVAVLASVVHAEAPKQLWVLQDPDRIIEYDPTTFVTRRTLTVPRRLLEHPEFLSVNARSQMLFVPPRGAEWTTGELVTARDRAWFWDGQQAKEWKLEGAKARSGGPRATVTESAREWFLSAGGESVVWFETTFEKVVEDGGGEREVRSTARVWRTDLGAGSPHRIAELPAPGWCRCETGVCSETCPEWSLWAPDGVVGDFFVVTRVTQGQTESRYHESLLYQRAGTTWAQKKVIQPLAKPLTGAEKGEVLVAAVPDGGCCGWENEGNDQTVLFRSGKAIVVYDEWQRYDNRNYDVSFYTADARLAPAARRLAYTIVATAGASGEIRVSSDGKEDPAELARLRKAIAALPAVEVVEPATSPRPLATISRAALVGWLSDTEILVAQEGRLVVFDIRGQRRKETTIRVRTAADAFLR
ncbi:MAG TPA: hypothetical protein VGL09_01570 [Methylomirabilota bacterium]